jgi:hypothetical protein
MSLVEAKSQQVNDCGNNIMVSFTFYREVWIDGLFVVE